MEPRFGLDFSQVRVHADERSSSAARAIGALAYTTGSDVVFGAGKYSPGNDLGKRLIAHELTHVLQQSGERSEGTAGFAAVKIHGSAVPSGLVQCKLDPTNFETMPGEAAPLENRVDPETASADAAPTPVDVQRIDYAFIFAHDAYGEDAKLYIRTFYPTYRMVEAYSLEQMIDRMWSDTKNATDTHRVRIREIIIVSHGNAMGGMTSVSLVPGGSAKFSPPDMAKLRHDFHSGLYRRFQERRTDVISRAIDENTHVQIKGCRIGQSEEALDALRSFMGGEATVTAPTTYQGFDTVQVPGPVFKDKDVAYDALLGSRIDLPERLVCRPDETKAACLDHNFPNGRIPTEFFVTSDEDRKKFKTISNAVLAGKMSVRTGQAASEVLKHRDVTSADEESSRASPLGQLSAEDDLSIEEIERDAKAILANYRPERAYMLVALRRAWERKKLNEPFGTSHDPLEGLPPEGIFGDPNVVGPDASRFPGPTTAVDPFKEEAPEVPDVSPEQRAAYAADETLEPDPTGVSRRRAAGTASGEMRLGADRITPDRPMPKPSIDVDVGQRGGKVPDRALVVRGEFTRSFEIKYEQQLGYLKVKKAIVDFNGKIDFKGEGKKELVIGAFGALSSKTGESASGGGAKVETTLAKGSDAETGVTGKISGGLSVGGQERSKEGSSEPSTQRGLKTQLYLSAQVAWGPVSQELKLVIVGIDETKSGTDTLTILGVDWSPIAVQGEFELPVSDGTKIKFTGAVKLTISAEPDWPKIIGQFAGRQVVTEGALVAGGATAGVGAAETAGTGAAAGGGAAVGELVIATGFLAGAAVAVGSYYKSIEEIEDLKELQRGADQGVADFCGAYLAHLGIGTGVKASGKLWDEGERHAELQIKARVARAARFYNERSQQKLFAEDDPELRSRILDGVKEVAESWRSAVYLTYETAIRTLFYNTWLLRVKSPTASQMLNARGRASLLGVEPTEEPDYDWVNSVGRRTAEGMRRPPNVR
jgi:hypothetical protein